MIVIILIVFTFIPWFSWTSITSVPDLITGWTAGLNGVIYGQKNIANQRSTDGALSTKSDRNFEAFLYQRLFTERKAGHNIDDHFVVRAYSSPSTTRSAASGKN